MQEKSEAVARLEMSGSGALVPAPPSTFGSHQLLADLHKMTPEQNKRAITDAWKAFASRDRQRIEAVFTEDAEWLAPRGNATAVALGVPDHMIGPEAIARFLVDDFPRLFVADVAVSFSHLHCDGDTVILEERMQATLAGGRHYDNDYCFVFELREGRIARVREYMDTRKGHAAIFG